MTKRLSDQEREWRKQEREEFHAEFLDATQHRSGCLCRAAQGHDEGSTCWQKYHSNKDVPNDPA